MIFRHLRNVRGFFSDYYLGSIFGRGAGRRRKLSDRDTDLAYARFRRIRERAECHAPDQSACRERFARPLFRDVLGFHLGAGENRIHGLFASAVLEDSGKPPAAICYCGGWDEDLDTGRTSAQPMHQLETNLTRLEFQHGILLTGDRLRLVRAPGEGLRGAYLEVDLAGLAEEDDPESFAAFYRLFCLSSFLPDAEGKVPIEEVEKESRRHAEKVSEDLKQAVFSAAESLAGGLICDAIDRGRIGSAMDLGESDILAYRDAALLALYRTLFILYAEARDPRLDEHRLYRDAYSAQGLLDELLREPARAWPDNRSSLWERLRALFKIFDEGLPPITPWQNIPPRGGEFFSSKTLEGRILDESRLTDRAVAQLMFDLATTAPRRGVGRERVSFRELDIENLGAVYEGLLEFEPRIARETEVDISVQGRTYALAPAEVARLCDLKNLHLIGDVALVADTPAEAFHPAGKNGTEEEEQKEDEEDNREVADNEDEGNQKGEEDEDEGVTKGSVARIVRRLDPGDFHFVPGPGRKGSGSFYTPRPLVQDLVHHALGPLIEGKTVLEIEQLRILDPACGSAHFLVEAMRFLGQALHRAYVLENGGRAPSEFRSTIDQGWDENWRAPDGEARAANSEARAWCKRRIAERCLFGVDLNQTAVELARVALWIESLAGDRPLSYFEHHIRPGNSLLGSWMGTLESPPLPDLSRRTPAEQRGLFQAEVRKLIEQAARLRRIIDEAKSEDLQREGIEPESVREQQFKEDLRRRAERILAAAGLLFNLRAASAFIREIWAEWNVLCSKIGSPQELSRFVETRPWWEAFKTVRNRERFFHWELEFPEIFLREHPGFDAVLGNPPWDKVLPARKDFYARYDVLLRAFSGNDLDQRIRELHASHPGLSNEFKEYRSRTTTIATVLRKSGDFPYSKARSGAAHEDVSKYFLDRAARLVRDGGLVGMVAPSVVYNGDGCVGFRHFLLREASIERFYGFENRRKIFPIHSSYKFVSLVFRKGEHEEDSFDAAFMRHDLDELHATARHRPPGREKVRPGPAPWVVTLHKKEIERLSAESAAFLEYREPLDQEIIRRLHEGQSTFGGEDSDGWGTRIISWRAHEAIFNATEDKDLWTDAKRVRYYTPDWVLQHVPADFAEVIEEMRVRGFWPVFEGKHVEQLLIGMKPIRWWLSIEQVERKYGRQPMPGPVLVFRETASGTNERTCIAAVLPKYSVATNKLYAVSLEKIASDAASTVMNSFIFDYALRFRVSTNVHPTYIRPIAVPCVTAMAQMPLTRTIVAWGSGITHVTDHSALWPDLWSANRKVAEAYGIGPLEFQHVLSSFRGVARKRPAFFAYLQSRLSEWAKEKGEKLRPEAYVVSEPVEELPRVAEEEVEPENAERSRDG